MPAAHITLTCLIEGDSSPFIVEPKEDISIMKMKDLIHEKRKNGVLKSVDATDLTLWRVRMTIASDSTTTTNSPAGGSRKPAQR